MSETTVSRVIAAPREAVFRACLDADALAAWRVPDGMEATVEVFDPRPGGVERITLRYLNAGDAGRGKSDEVSDTFEGRFLEVVPLERIVEQVTFASEDPGFAGTMTVTTSLADAAGGTEITIRCAHLPPGIDPADNVAGTEESLARLAALVAEPV